MLTRRGLFGFAAGGAVAAPMLLKGEQANATVAPLVHGETPIEPQGAITIQVDGAEGDAYVRRLVREAVKEAVDDFHKQQRRGGFGALQARYLSRQA